MRNWPIILIFPILTQGQLTNTQLEALWQTQRSGFFSSTDPHINPNLGMSIMDDGNAKGFGYQSHYFNARNYYALLMHWKATGTQQDFDDLKRLIDEHMAAAVDVDVTENGETRTYKGYPSVRECVDGGTPGVTPGYTIQEGERCAYGTPLWDIFIWRHIAHFLADIHYSPTLKASVEATYPGWFDGVIAFSQANIYEKYLFSTSNGTPYGNFHRNRTHISKEAAEYLLYMWAVNQNQDYFDRAKEIIEEGMPRYDPYADPPGIGDNFKEQLEYVAAEDLYIWPQTFRRNTASYLIQDVDHFGHFVSSLLAAYFFGFFTETDMVRFANTLDKRIMVNSDYANYAYHGNVDGTGSDATNGNTAVPMFRLGEFIRTINDKIANNIDANDDNRDGYAAIALYNQKILDDGRPVYPEHYVLLDGPFGGSAVPNLNQKKKEIFNLIYH